MSSVERPQDDVFLPGGRIRPGSLAPAAADALHSAIRLARETRWDCVRSPHIFMGLLANPDPVVCVWGQRLGADLSKLLGQFQELFHQENGESEPVISLYREFLSDNDIGLLLEAQVSAVAHQCTHIAP